MVTLPPVSYTHLDVYKRQALLWTGGHPSKEAQSLLEQIRHIDGDFEFETYYSLSCHNLSLIHI